MDRWILARCQSLIKLVRQEMAAYRLYTIVPRLLDLVDELTNWYIRFNRKRLKGEDGKEDTIKALNTLFETLFTLCRTMSSYTPFLTETLYQGLRPFIPEPSDPKQDTRSIHFLGFPEVKEEYFDEEIERKIKRMQTIIELTRNVRDKHTLPVKTPLKELLVFHPEVQYLDDVRPLQRYLQSELNVRDIVFTSDEVRSGVRYKATADWPVLGRKLRKDINRVKNGLPLLSSEDVKGYVETGIITVDGIQLVQGDLTVSRYVELPTDNEQATFAPNTDNDVVIVLDIQIHPELIGEGLARELINRVQKLRKKAGLQATDDIEVFYRFNQGADPEDLKRAMVEYEEMIRRTVRNAPRDVVHRSQGKELIIEEEQEIADVKFSLLLVRA